MRALRSSVLLAALLSGLLPAVGAHTARAAQRAAPERLVVLNIELTGDLGGPAFAAEHARRLRVESARLRREIEDSGLFEVVDNTPARPLIDKLSAEYRYLHDCNGCDLDIGKALHADKVLVAWVDRVSGLILTLTYEIHDVATREITDRRSYDFRGDNDNAWNHAIAYMVRDMKSRAAQPRTGSDPNR